MGKKNDSTIVAGAGLIADVFLKLRADVIDLGGSDEDLFALNKGDGRSTIRKMAEVIVAAREPKTLADMLRAGHYNFVNSEITEEHFPVGLSLFTTKSSEVCSINCTMTTKEIVADFRRCGWEIADIARLLAYGAENPDEQRKYPIVALASSWKNSQGDKGVACLSGHDGGRGVSLRWVRPETKWDAGGCRFLAIRNAT